MALLTCVKFLVSNRIRQLRKITLDVRPDLHQRLRFLSVLLDRSIASLAVEALEKMVADYPTVCAEAFQVDRASQVKGPSSR